VAVRCGKGFLSAKSNFLYRIAQKFNPTREMRLRRFWCASPDNYL
jgi:hypothetical protein